MLEVEVRHTAVLPTTITHIYGFWSDKEDKVFIKEKVSGARAKKFFEKVYDLCGEKLCESG